MKYLIVLIGLLICNWSIAQPNIIFILADDLGYGDVSAYGSKEVQTPNIDKIAGEGIVFKSAYANSTVCSPSRASILFGDYPDLLGVPGVIRDVQKNTWGNLRDDVTSLPDQLGKLGYQSALIGKWHLGYNSPDHPLDRGFDYFKGFLGDMMDDYFTHERHGMNWMRENEKEINPQGHATELFTDWAKEYISEKADAKEPFFMFLAYNAPHDPIQPPEKNLSKVQKRFPDMPLKRQKLVALIEHLDQNIGEVTSLLKKEGIDDETIIVFTSDNGGALRFGADNSPWNGGKGDMFEGGIRIPCIVSWPEKLQPAAVNTPFLLMDFYKVLPSLANSNNIDQLAFQKMIQESQRDYMVWVRREGHRFGGRAYYAISDGNYKLLQNSPYEPFRLFSIENDPGELSPIDNPEKEKELFEKLTEHIQQSGKVPWQ